MNLVSTLQLSEGQSIFLANVLLQATLISATALIIGRWFVHKVATRHSLLFCALALIICSPVTLACYQRAGFSLLSWPVVEQRFPFVSAESGALYFGGPDGIIDSKYSTESPLDRNHPGSESAMRSESHRIGTTGFPAGTLVGLILLVWAAGFMIFLLRFGTGYRRLLALIQNAKPAAGPELEKISVEAGRAVGIPTIPPIMVSSTIESPVAAGIRNPVIILPGQILEEMSFDELRQVLTHEMAHLVRRDPVTVMTQHLVDAVLWFHPLVRLLNRDLACAREEICDNYVLASTAGTEYSRLLLRLAVIIGGNRPLPASSSLLTSQWKLEHRVAGILSRERNLQTTLTKRGGVVALLFLASLIFVGAMTTLVPASGEAAPPSEPAPSSESLPEGDEGIAANYHGDQLIGNDPSVLFADDFETYTSIAQLQSKWDITYGNQLGLNRNADHAPMGKQSLQVTIPVTEDGNRTGGAVAKRFTETLDVLFLRWYQKFDREWSLPAQWSENGAILSASYFTNGASPGIPADGRNKFLVGVGQINKFGNSPGHLGVGLYWPEQVSPWSDYFFPSGRVLPHSGTRSGKATFGSEFKARAEFTPDLDRWYCYETMLKANTPGLRNGRLAIWIDGKLIADFPNLRFRDVEDLGIDRFDLSTFVTESRRINRVWRDNVVAATSYIGPIANPEKE